MLKITAIAHFSCCSQDPPVCLSTRYIFFAVYLESSEFQRYVVAWWGYANLHEGDVQVMALYLAATRMQWTRMYLHSIEEEKRENTLQP
jgi:hypothetical protein